MAVAARNPEPVAIAGGGIGGLATALGLARAGFSSIVLEQAREFGEVGVGLQVAPNALSVLDALGVGGRVKKDAFLIERMLMKDGVSGETIVDIPCDTRFIERFGNPYAVAHRADIHGALLEACRAHERVELRNNARVSAYDIEDPGVSVTLESGERMRAAALVGADGVYSRVRKQMLDDGDPFASGFIIYRAVIPAAEMPRDAQHPYPTMWAGPNTHLIYYPVRDWKMFNFGATVLTGQLSVDEQNEAPPGEALPLFAEMCETPLRVMRIPKSFRRYVIRRRDPVDNWSQGPVTLLGDGAHPMVQFIAQGAAMALEDAACLAVAADETDGDFAQAFQRYQAIRIVRASRVQISSWMMDRILHPGGVERLVRNSIFEGRTHEENLERLAWLYQAPPYVRQCALLGAAG
jgi:2-polyprenyl-6-methoxyphenol hydroxylase-like FAD-dependent oxidoreductase